MSSSFQVRAQLNVLKGAVVDEQRRSADFKEQLLAKDSALRKYVDETESLQFRNTQLVKRVETLQKSLDELSRLPATKGKKVRHNPCGL